MEKGCTSRLAFKVTGKLKESQRVSGFALVVAQLFRQLLRRGELPGLAEPQHEIDPHVSAIEISIGVEQMRLERGRGISESRTRSEIHHTADRPSGRLNPNRIYTFRR